MDEPQDRSDDDRSALDDIVSWEPTTTLDRFAVSVHRSLIEGIRVLLVVTAASILGVLLVVTGLGAITDPYVFSLVILSVVPALGLAVFIRMADVGVEEPLSVLTVTFLLGVLFAGFAGILNAIGFVLLAAVPLLSTVLFYYLVVGPVEEGIKLLAVRLHAFRHHRFDAVIDGAIYGAAAGLGFATIENALYITDALDAIGSPMAVVDAVGETTAVRALAGPGHVIYSAIAGYYLGLAKFNPRHAGPLVIKGLTIAATIHATYNVLVQIVPGVVMALTGIGLLSSLLAFIVVYDGLAAYYLYRKLSSYRRAYRSARHHDGEVGEPELTEFDPG